VVVVCVWEGRKRQWVVGSLDSGERWRPIGGSGAQTNPRHGSVPHGNRTTGQQRAEPVSKL